MLFRSKMPVGTAVLVAALLFGALTTGPAFADVHSAGAAPTECPVGRLCLYEEPVYAGAVVMVAPHPVGTCVNLPPTGGDVGSVKNRLRQDVVLFRERGCRGASIRLDANDNLRVLPPGLDNQVKSVRFVPPEPAGSRSTT